MHDRWVNIADKITEYSLYAIIFFIPISNAGIESFFGFAILGFTIKKILKPDFSFLRSRANFFLLLFFIFNAVSLSNSGIYLSKSLKALVFKWVEYILIFLIAQDTLAKTKRARNAVGVFLFGAALVGIDGIFQRFSGMDFLRHRALLKFGENVAGISASFSHYNSLGAYLTFLLPLVTALLLFSKNKSYRYGLIAQTALLGICLLLTSSRGSWLGFSAAMVFMLFLTRKMKPILLMLGMFIFVIILMQSLRERFYYTFQPRGDGDRFIMWNTAFAIIRENPFIGKGVGTFMDYFHKSTPSLVIQYAHNCFLQLWAEIGIFGLASFILFIGSIIAASLKMFRRKKDSILLGLTCGVSGFLVHSFFDTNLYGVQLSVLFWMSAGLITAKIKAEDNLPQPGK